MGKDVASMTPQELAITRADDTAPAAGDVTTRSV